MQSRRYAAAVPVDRDIEFTDLLLVARALAYVAIVGRDTPHRRVVEKIFADGLGVAPQAVGTPQAEVHLNVEARVGLGFDKKLPRLIEVVRVDQRRLDHIIADPLLGVVTQDSFYRQPTTTRDDGEWLLTPNRAQHRLSAGSIHWSDPEPPMGTR